MNRIEEELEYIAEGWCEMTEKLKATKYRGIDRIHYDWEAKKAELYRGESEFPIASLEVGWMHIGARSYHTIIDTKGFPPQGYKPGARLEFSKPVTCIREDAALFCSDMPIVSKWEKGLPTPK
jgi:hypothetical protein